MNQPAKTRLTIQDLAHMSFQGQLPFSYSLNKLARLLHPSTPGTVECGRLTILLKAIYHEAKIPIPKWLQSPTDHESLRVCLEDHFIGDMIEVIRRHQQY
jgi:hypothetical protein